MFKKIRILLLLCVLLFVALSAYTMDSDLRDWDKTKWVAIYPINGDGSQAARDYIKNLDNSDFEKMERFLNREAERFGVSTSQPFKITLAPELSEKPPAPPQRGAWYENAWWSIETRLWASKAAKDVDGPPADIKIFTEFYDPKMYEVLPHSVGIRKLSLAVVKAFATRKMTQSNNIVMAHELLHVFGATDKYDLNTNLPIYPMGYVKPDQKPLFPQKKAEIMAGRIPKSKTKAQIPSQFKQVIIGEQTATEIGWSKL